MALDNPIDAALSSRATQILGSADALLPDPTSSLLQTAGAAGPATDLIGSTSGGTASASSTPLPSGVTDLANSAVLDLHQALETTSDLNGVAYTVHGLTNLGETVGLGKIGGTNLVTEALNAPTALVSGASPGTGSTVPSVAAVADAASGLVSGAAHDAGLNSSSVLPAGQVATQVLDAATTSANGVGAALSSAGTAGVDGVLNQTVDALAPTVGLVGGSIAHDTTAGLLNVTNAIGLGDIGGQNLLTDLGHLPSSVLSGDATPLTNLPTDLASIGNAVSGTIDGLGNDTTTSTILGTLTHLTTGTGILGGEMPGQGATDSVLSPVDNVVNEVGMLNGIAPITQATTAVTDGLLGGSSSPVSGLVQGLGGAGNGLSALPSELGSTIDSLGHVVSVASGELGHSGVLADVIGPVSSLVDGGTGGLLGSLPGGGAGGAAATLDSALNQLVDTLAPTIGSIAGSIAHDTASGLLGTASAAGLGDLGGNNLLTDVAHVPTAILSGDATSLTNLPGDLASVANGVAATVDGLGNDTTTSTILGAVTHLTDGGTPTSAVPGLSAVLSDVAPQVDNLVNGVGVLNGIQPITTPATGAVDSLVHLPDAITSGGLASLPADLGSNIGSLGDVVSSVAGQLPDSGVLSDVIGPVSGLFGDQAGALGILPTGGTNGPIHNVTAPVDALLNQTLDALAPTVSTVGGSIAHDTTGGLLDTASAAGLGDLGGHNLITDLAQAPAGTLGGDTTSLTNLPGDLASVANGVAATVDGLGNDTTTSTILGAVTHLTDGGQPVSAVPGLSAALSDVAPQVDNLVNGVGALNGIQPITSAATAATDSLAHLPDAVTSGGLASLPADLGSNIGSLGHIASVTAGELPSSGVLADVLGPVLSLVDGGGTSGVTSTVTNLLGEAGGSGVDGAPHTVTGLLDGAASGGALGTLTGALGGGASPLAALTSLIGDATGTAGSGHSVGTLALGPQTASNGAGIDLLSNAGGLTQLVETHAGTAAAPSPSVGGTGVLSDASFHFPTLSSGGGDALSGVLQSVGTVAIPTAGAGAAHPGIDLGVAHVDIPIATAHADPLASLAHAIPHV